jgi:hypothetical protein
MQSAFNLYLFAIYRKTVCAMPMSVDRHPSEERGGMRNGAVFATGWVNDVAADVAVINAGQAKY